MSLGKAAEQPNPAGASTSGESIFRGTVSPSRRWKSTTGTTYASIAHDPAADFRRAPEVENRKPLNQLSCRQEIAG
jgi:hypothetical protein